MAKHSSKIGPSQKVRCRGGKHHINPQQIEGPPRLRSGGNVWEQIEMYSKPAPQKKEVDSRLDRLFAKASKKK